MLETNLHFATCTRRGCKLMTLSHETIRILHAYSLNSLRAFCILVIRFHSVSQIPIHMRPSPVPIIAGSLIRFLSKPLEMSEILDDWKTVTVTPIYKKGPRNDTSNYIFVSLTSI